jgi:hypothetical protein
VSERRELFAFTPDDFEEVSDGPPRLAQGAVVHAIRRLTSAKTTAVYNVLIAFVSLRVHRSLSEAYFSTLDVLATDEDGAAVELWLRARDADEGQDVLLAFGYHHEVYRINWGLFCAHWQDLCFYSNPGDDIVIAPVTEAWVLFYFHEEIFYWGKPRQKATGYPLAANTTVIYPKWQGAV